MRSSIGIVVAIMTIATFWAWTLAHSGANPRSKLPIKAISTIDLTKANVVQAE